MYGTHMRVLCHFCCRQSHSSEEQTAGAVPLESVAVSSSVTGNSTRVLKYEYMMICSQEEWRQVTMEVV